MSSNQISILNELDANDTGEETSSVPASSASDIELAFGTFCNFDPNKLFEIEDILSNEIQGLSVSSSIVATNVMTGERYDDIAVESMDIDEVELVNEVQPQIELSKDIIDSAEAVVNYMRSADIDDVIRARLLVHIADWKLRMSIESPQSNLDSFWNPQRPRDIQ